MRLRTLTNTRAGFLACGPRPKCSEKDLPPDERRGWYTGAFHHRVALPGMSTDTLDDVNDSRRDRAFYFLCAWSVALVAGAVVLAVCLAPVAK